LHKLWLSEQADREPVKKQRDHDQGLAVAQLIIQYLPQYQFNTSELRMFPKDVVQKPVRHRLRLQVCRMGI
jgi:Nucleotidyltransferase